MKVVASEHRDKMSYLELPLRSSRRLGRIILLACHGMGHALIMLGSATLYIRTIWRPRARHETIAQLYVTGIKSLGVITVVAVFTGMILALQTGLELRRYGQEEFIGSAVSISIIREMGPFMTGLIIAASVGSAIAAQLGTMTVSEEIAALEVMSINPNRFLVMPRLVALAIMLPILTVYTNILASRCIRKVPLWTPSSRGVQISLWSTPRGSRGMPRAVPGGPCTWGSAPSCSSLPGARERSF